MNLEPGKFYAVKFCTGGNPVDGNTYDPGEVVCYIGELNGQHLFDSLSIVKVLGPKDLVTHGPSTSPLRVHKIEYSGG